MKRYSLLYMLLCLATIALAQGPNNTGTYYKNADGAKGKALKTALADIISSHTTLSYSEIWNCYKSTDLRSDGKIWDMYSNITNFDPDKDRAGSYSSEGDVFNREHSFPKSWFNEASPMVTDLMHIVPTDGYVNGRRSNYPFGETDGDMYKSANDFSKLGSSKTEGYTGTVFEPNDEYKGDFARIYFYMVTCYESQVSSWSCDMLSGDKYPAFSDWALNLLLKWAANDPVSQKEVDRNNAVYKLQGNRNPFVDYPGLEQYVWGASTDKAFDYDQFETVDPDNPDNPVDPDDPDNPDNPDNPDEPDTPVEGSQTYILVADASNLIVGQDYLLVCEDASVALTDLSENAKYFTTTTVNISGDEIKTDVGQTGQPHALVLGGTTGNYTFYDAVAGGYLSLGSDANSLNMTEEDCDNSRWTITISDGSAVISNNAYTNRSIQYNASAPRFACYKSAQTPVSLYINKVSQGIDNITATSSQADKVYSLDGRYLCPSTRVSSLPRGLYIINGHKLLVK